MILQGHVQYPNDGEITGGGGVASPQGQVN